MDSANPNIGNMSLISTIDTWQFLTRDCNLDSQY
jgi:hypothetical protein